MVEERLKLEPEVQEIFTLIDQGRDFLLSGGAGSGKTYSLVHVIRQIILENATAKIACMTYTNAAVHEIEERVNHSNLSVSTIHDFLWDSIKHFQEELKSAIIALANDPDVRQISLGDEEVPSEYFDGLEDGIQYKEFVILKRGIISHDELLIVANHLFKTYPKLCHILQDKFDYVLVDEYQDTNPLVIEILLEHLIKSDNRNSIIGLFGDAMQSIYDDGVGNINNYKGEAPDKVKEVKKSQNRRNPQKVINLANRLRTDGLEQRPSEDESAPNMVDGQIKQGTIFFIHSENEDISRVKDFLIGEHGWDFDNTKETKELNLTHNLIAEKAGFKDLMEIYDKDRIIDYRNRIKHFIKDNEIDEDFSQYTFGEVIEFLKEGKTDRELKKVSPTGTQQHFIDDNQELYEEALSRNFDEFKKLYFDKDQLIDDKKQDADEESKKGSKRDNLIKHLYKIQSCISFYNEGQYNEFLRLTDYRIRLRSIADKRDLRNKIDSLTNVRDKTIEEVITEANESGICLIDDRLDEFIQKKEYLYNRVKTVKYKEFQSLYEYLEGKTPFSTQHKVKGAEFDNVFIILDNGNWNNYNFQYLFLNNGNPSVLERTQKIFYTCCTRAKESLAIFFHAPSDEILQRATEWFGEDNIVEL